MGTCDVCGNQYDKAFRITLEQRDYTFDCFECAIHALAPRCNHCGVAVVGHGAEAEGVVFCCAHCAKQEGQTGVRDRIERRSA